MTHTFCRTPIVLPAETQWLYALNEGANSMPAWLKCTISKGMFCDEVTAVIRTRYGGNLSVFIPKDFAEESASRIRVRVSDQSGNHFVILPNDVQTVVDVDGSDLLPA